MPHWLPHWLGRLSSLATTTTKAATTTAEAPQRPVPRNVEPRRDMASHLLTALPNELLLFVIDNLDRVEDIAALALSNRHLHSIANPLLYRRAVQCHDARPLAWAASRGLVATLRMTIAAGADVNHLFSEDLPAEEWERATAADRAAAAAGRPKELWGTWDYGSSGAVFRVREKPADPTSATAEDGGGGGGDDDDDDDDEGDGDSRHDADAGTPSSTSTADQSGRRNGGGTTSDQDSVVSSDGGDGSRLAGATPATDPPTPLPEPRTMLRRRYTAMHLAARGGHDEVIKILRRAGAHLDAMSERFCACTKLYGLLNALEHPVSRPAVPWWSPLHVAICHARTPTAKLLLSLKAPRLMDLTPLFDTGESYDDPSILVPCGATAMHHAAAMGLTDLVAHLLDLEGGTAADTSISDIDAPDEHGLTPFYHAYARRRWDSTAALLRARGADVDCLAPLYIPYSAITPLGEACRLGDFEAADRLLELGADVRKGFVPTSKTQMLSGCLTPLHMCCMRSARAAGRPDGEEEGKEEEEEEAKKGKKGDQDGGGVEADDDEAKGRARVRTIQNLIARGAPLDARDCFGSTPLMAAVSCNNTYALEALRLAGAADEDNRAGLDRDGVTRRELRPRSRRGVMAGAASS